MMKKSPLVILAVLVSVLSLAATSALAFGGPGYAVRVKANPVQVKEESLEGVIDKVQLDQMPAYAEIKAASGKTVRVYLGGYRVLAQHKDKFVAGKQVKITGYTGPAGFMAFTVKVDGQDVQVRGLRVGQGQRFAPGQRGFYQRGAKLMYRQGWRAGFGAGWAACQGACPTCPYQQNAAPVQTPPAK